MSPSERPGPRPPRNPSPEVFEALARALQLDNSEREHLTDLLARSTAPRRGPTSPQRVRAGLHLMLQTLPAPGVCGSRVSVSFRADCVHSF